MKSLYVNLVCFFSVLSLSSILFLTVSAQTDETNSTVTRETNSDDVLAIKSLLDTFYVLPGVGDPCLPTPFSWVKCSSDDTPRVTEINLYHSLIEFGITHIPDFSAMDALEKIDIGDNALVRIEFPDFLANFPKLKLLYLVGTPFYGTVPTSLKKRRDNKTLKLYLPVAKDLCFSDEDVCPPATGSGTETSPGTDEDTSTTSFSTPPTKSRKKKTTPIVLGTLIPIFVIFSAVVGFLIRNHQKRKAAAAAGQMNGTSGPAMPMHGIALNPNPLIPEINSQDLESAAQNILPGEQGVTTDRQMHPPAQAT